MAAHFVAGQRNGPVFLSALAMGVLMLSGWLGEHIDYLGRIAMDVADHSLRKRMSPQKSR